MLDKKKFFGILLFWGDVFFLILALFLALAIRYNDFSFWPGPQTQTFVYHFSLLSLVWFFFLFLLDFYEPFSFRDRFSFFFNLTVFALLAGMSGAIYFYVQPPHVITPKTILFLDVLFFSFFVFAWRYLVIGLTSLRWLREKILFIGFQREVKELLSFGSFGDNYEVVGFFLPADFRDEKGELRDYKIVNNLDELKELMDRKGIDSLVLVPGFKDNNELMKKVFSFFSLRVKYLNFADLYEGLSRKVLVRSIDNVWLMENLSPIDRKADETIKRIFDLVFSLLGLLFFAPLFPFLALAIKLDSPGPVIYSQERVGKRGKTFVLYKLRTMVADAEKWGPRWAKPGDPRITRVGKILRKTHLDELPQLVNILKGEMSFVGPRPERPAFVEQLKNEIPYYDVRHLVKPGFTGWAQINYRYGASVKDAEEKLKYELYYIKNRFFFLDLGIILKTLRLVFKG